MQTSTAVRRSLMRFLGIRKEDMNSQKTLEQKSVWYRSLRPSSFSLTLSIISLVIFIVLAFPAAPRIRVSNCRSMQAHHFWELACISQTCIWTCNWPANLNRKNRSLYCWRCRGHFRYVQDGVFVNRENYYVVRDSFCCSRACHLTDLSSELAYFSWEHSRAVC